VKDGKKYLIECKRYAENRSVGRRDLQIFRAAMLETEAVEGFCVTTGRFTETAIAYALQNGIDLYDRTRLAALVNRANGLRADATHVDAMCPECGEVLFLALGTDGVCQNGHVVPNHVRVEEDSILAALKPPQCRTCGSEMKIVKGSQGAFWGCSRYPTCQSSQSIMGRAQRFRRMRK
jgi:restriction system protein